MRVKWLLMAWVSFVVLLVGSLGLLAYYNFRPKSEHCLLTFGPEEKLKVWLTVRNDRFFLDPSGGKSPGRGEDHGTIYQFRKLSIADPDGETTYHVTGMNVYDDTSTQPPGRRLLVNVDVQGKLNFRQYADVHLHADANQANVAHFNGQLAIHPRSIFWKIPPDAKLVRGEKPAEIGAYVGTMDAQRGCWVVVRCEDAGTYTFGVGNYPYAMVEFPGRTPNDPPITQRYELDKFC